MGVSTEQWRATIGQWIGGKLGKCVTLQHCNDQTSHNIGYKQIRFLLLLSLLVIGCVELNPGQALSDLSHTQTNIKLQI
jgi:hypothetical protein